MKELIKKYPNDSELGRAVRKKYLEQGEDARDQLIDLLEGQVIELTMLSKIEIGDDVIKEIIRLKSIINEDER
jgi:hypothetical protein